MDYCNIGSARIAYKVFGEGKKTVVIDTGLGSCSAEWWHIAEALGDDYKVILYDRAGYGESSLSSLKRTPRNIAVELDKMLNLVGIEKDFTIIGHSQGGLYAVQYAYTFAGKVKGLILLDPATPFDNIFKEKLTDEEYKKSGVDKTISYKIGLVITSLGLGFAIKPLLKKAPPFFYYKFSEPAKKYILAALSRKNTYKTALAEYESTHNDVDTEDIVNAIDNSLMGNIPIKIITHSSDLYIEELKYYGNMGEQTAKKVENLWQDIMKRYLHLSSNTEHITSPNSGHFIHLTDFEVLKNTVDSF
ncbi:MAG: alpha/beta hydrolase [Clostridiaceae bacterium]